jgi:SWI/SNF-related matrix-associated actin-dependent regulator 1 of chromatin subfamily A
MIKLRKYQRVGVRKMIGFNLRCLNADDMGLGKTIQTAAALRKHRRALPALIVTPASVKWNWQDELADHFGLSSFICESQTPPTLLEFDPGPFDIGIINYDILQYWTRWLRRSFGYRTIVFDECQMLRGRTTKRLKAARRAASRAIHRIGLSGSPIMNRPEELWPILSIVRPDLYPHFRPFGMEFCKPTVSMWGIRYTGATNKKRLNRKLTKELMIRRTKDEVLKDLPPKTRQTIPLDIFNRRSYEKAERDMTKWLRAQLKGKKKKNIKRIAGARMFVLKKLAAELKLHYAAEWVKNFLEDTDETLILFGYHKKVIRYFRDLYPDISVVIDGSVTGRKRKEAAYRFNNDKKIRLLLGNIDAAGVGLNLQKRCRSVAFVELGWNPAQLSQAEDRVYRLGQTFGVNIYYLIAKGTIEESMCRMIQKKQKDISEIIDGGTTEQNDFDILGAVVKGLLRRVA